MQKVTNGQGYSPLPQIAWVSGSWGVIGVILLTLDLEMVGRVCCHICIVFCIHWNGKVVILMKLASLAAQKAVKMKRSVQSVMTIFIFSVDEYKRGRFCNIGWSYIQYDVSVLVTWGYGTQHNGPSLWGDKPVHNRQEINGLRTTTTLPQPTPDLSKIYSLLNYYNAVIKLHNMFYVIL